MHSSRRVTRRNGANGPVNKKKKKPARCDPVLFHDLSHTLEKTGAEAAVSRIEETLDTLRKRT